MSIGTFIASRLIKDRNRGTAFSRPINVIAIIGIALGLAVMILAVSILTGFKQRVLCDSLVAGESDRAATGSSRTPQLVHPRLIGGVDSTFLRFSLAAVVD